MQDFPDQQPDHSPRLSDLERAARSAQRALVDLYRQACNELNDIPEQAPSFTLNWSPDGPPEQLADGIIQRLKQLQPTDQIVQRGRVYCYHCETSDCEHARPNLPGDVFGGYENNGTPIWRDLFNQLLAVSENRADRLFEARPAVLAHIVSRKQLIAEQLSAYGRDSMTYRIIAQIVAGYFNISGVRCALTVQIVETPDHALHVQALLPDTLWDHLANADRPHSLLYRVHDAISRLRRSVKQLQSQWQQSTRHAERIQHQEKLYSMLRKLISSIEQKDRQGKRRTRHAEQRSKQKRPVHKAAEDVAAATGNDFYIDTVRQSKIVVGRAGRCHVFSDTGRHITTLQLPGDKLDRRLRTKRYVPLPKDEVDELRPAILNYSEESSSAG